MSSRSGFSWRKLSAQSVAVLAVAMAAAWGPMAHSLRVAVSIAPDSASSFRLVLAKVCDQPKQSKQTKSDAPKKSGAQKTSPQTEQLFTVVPDNLVSAASIHFDLDQAPARFEPPSFDAQSEFSAASPALSIKAALLAREHLPRGPPLL